MFAEFADLYRACTVVGISPPVADLMEVWEVAAALGCARPPDDDDAEYRGNRPSSLPGGVRKIPGSEELLMRQMAEASGG